MSVEIMTPIINPPAQISPSMLKPSIYGRTLSVILNALGRISPKSAGRAAFRVMCTPIKTKIRPKDRQFLDTAGPLQVKVNGINVRGFAWGEGPTILLVHGWSGQSSDWQSYVARLLEAGYKIIAFDAPAHGVSAGKFLPPSLYIKTLEAILSSTGRVYGIIAHSLGALATVLALSQLKLLPPRKLVLMSAYKDVDTFFSDHFYASLNKSTLLQEAIQQYRSDIGDSLSSRSLTDILPLIGAHKVLIVHDQEDVVSPVRIGKQLARRCPNAHLLLTTGLGHTLNHAIVVDAIVQFIAGNQVVGTRVN